MNYPETLQYLFTRLPMFQRIGSAAYKADLNNTIALCRLLGNPENKFPSVHIAGTNGKGSCSHMIASVLQAAGYRTGLYTSPHLKDFRERIRINGEMIPEKAVVDFVEKHKMDFEAIQPSFFEMTVGMAFDHFAKEKVDIAVIEVGLGGRLDSTNVITPLLSLITNISFDHVALLGDTIEKIAAEKAGIIKENIPVIIGESQPLSRNVFVEKAREMNSSILFADHVYRVESISPEGAGLVNVFRSDSLYLEALKPGLQGGYQRKNIPSVLCMVDALKQKGYSIPDPAICDGIANVVKRTGLMGRWQVLSADPLVIADTGHNEAGIREVLEQIGSLRYNKLHVVLAMVNDKDITKMLSLLPKNALYYFSNAIIPRALPAEELKMQANAAGLTGKSYRSVREALEEAKRTAGKDDLVFVGGSTFTVAEVL